MVEKACWPNYYGALAVMVLSPEYYYKPGVKKDEYSGRIVESKRKDLSNFFNNKIICLFDKKKKEYSLQSFNLITVIPGSKSSAISPTMCSIGNNLSKHSNIPFELILERTRASQWSERKAEQRFKDVSGSMKLTRRLRVEEKKILLLDDTRTTGMTVLECAKLLIESGAEEVLLICLGTNTKKQEVD
ncbi:hypothetical protein HZB90_01665 [archaeon]|nr:hypothetical protein [archaeon]